MRRTWAGVWLLIAVVGTAGACATALASAKPNGFSPAERTATLRRSRVWTPTDIPSLDLRRGPSGSGAFAPGETITCDFVEHKFRSKSPKFQCAISADDDVKVKYGRHNGEVYGEVAATRLLWALGFGADRMYPVRVICRGCPANVSGEPGDAPGATVVDVAAVEREAPGRELETHPGEGWTWAELDLIEEAAGGAPRAHRDALKLLAVFIQHGDNKPEQQRLVCLDSERAPDQGDTVEPDRVARRSCEQPFMLIQDTGLTFGRANLWDRQDQGSVNFARWSSTPVWKDEKRCVGNLPKSFTGSLHDPVISEAGRQFLADLLGQLSDRQIRDLFDVAGFATRTFAKATDAPNQAGLDEWVGAFKQKRDEITNRRCEPAFALTAPGAQGPQPYTSPALRR